MNTDLQLARHAALAGAAVGLRYFADLAELPREYKSDGSVVTAADRAVEAAVRAVLADARPGDAVLGEESGPTGTGARRWIVDPIDGTALFVAGDDRWLVLVALEEDGEIVAGVVVVPAQGRIWWASRGEGAFAARYTGDSVGPGQRLQVGRSRPDGLAGSVLGVIPTDDGLFPAEREMLAPLTAVATKTAWGVHAALLVAGGEFDLAVQTRGHVWDFAATSLIVTEAGGCYGGLDGRTRPGRGTSVFARDAGLHAAALDLLVRGTGTMR
ncbi:inositol monophosphatase family protein [Cryptosporangium arvum]|uniref:Inositol monophosphatase/fructose-1,6-bisphosphatase family protein n=1 Tax=Cryptosporangium arvum DSM 44712 TaxID=927661 RepID=A0A011ALZ2_9ACTN|nr:inositol monophosphatase [Cryptosporangium arvum]EXG82981.1 inositol monophosphatase/fructose-1,6-bisphosphatase family protein [Cryptosporangium arvum DSM 44712]